MNYPQQPYPGQPPQPQQAPPAYGAPMPPPGYAQPAPYAQPVPYAQAAQTNLFNQFLTAPPRQRYNREKVADGQHVVQLLGSSKVGFSQKDGQQYLAIDYIVVDSTVPSERNKQFGFVIKPTTRSAQEGLAELVKSIFGVQYAQSLVQQGMVTPAVIMEQIVNACRMGTIYMLLETARSKKQVAEGVPYAEAYVSHDFRIRLPQPMSMEQVLQMQAQASGAATMPPLAQQAPPQQHQQAPSPGMPPPPPQQTYQPQPPAASPQPNVYQPQPVTQQQPPAAFPAPAPPPPPGAFPQPQQPPAPPAYTPPQAPPGAFAPFPPQQR